MKQIDAEHVAAVGAILGEGPVWVERDQALWFVDIKMQRVHRLDPATRAILSWLAPAQPGWLFPSADGGFLSGLASGLHRFDPASGLFHLYAEVEPDRPGNRLNDAAVDPSGRVWFGSMDNAEREVTGRLHHLFQGRIRDSGLDPVRITNGPAISPDGRTLYAVDTAGGVIDAYDVGADGALSGRRRFLTLDRSEGFPDGAICDAEGGVWVGLFNGWAAHRYAPDGGLTHVARFPVANVTKIALGGPDRRTAYATTARMGLSPSALAAQPLAGDIFAFRVDIPGLRAPEVALDFSSHP